MVVCKEIFHINDVSQNNSNIFELKNCDKTFPECCFINTATINYQHFCVYCEIKYGKGELYSHDILR